MELRSQLYNSSLKISGLTVNQLKDIYTGKITNWEQLGGPKLPITFVIVKQNGQSDEQAGEAYANLLLTDQGQELIAKAGFVRLG